MCGIVGYFGRAGNNLTRVLTAMSAIIYRAPDSTGVGLFGDDQEPIRLRRALGSVEKLSEALLGAAAYPNQPAKLLALWGTELEPDLSLRQLRLLEYEGLSTRLYESFSQGKAEYPTLDHLLHPETGTAVEPGQPGRPFPMRGFHVHSEGEMEGLIRKLTQDFDLSFVVIRALIREALAGTLSQAGSEPPLPPEEIIGAFDRVFDEIFSEGGLPEAVPPAYQWEDPRAEALMWEYLGKSDIRVPEDYDRDGVRGLFRLLDAALICRLPAWPDLHVRLQRWLERQWPQALNLPNTDWRTLYWAEKGANLYGRAGGAVLSYLEREFHHDFPFNAQIGKNLSGQTDPHFLNYLSRPIIAHGRWAIQSPVTLKNCHPFYDAYGYRAVVLNGQFNGGVEAETRDFLEQIAEVEFRSDNSTELFGLLWGYYFDVLNGEKGRYDAIRRQGETRLSECEIGSRIIDFQVYSRLKNRSQAELDGLAFLEAARWMTQKGGQIAVAGISLYSPNLLYVISHNRPAFVVSRLDREDYMVVSDVNAALGLFSQTLIHQQTLSLTRMRREHRENLDEVRKSGDKKKVEAYKKAHEAREKALLESHFKVLVWPLEGEEIFVRIHAEARAGQIRRRLSVTDFDGEPLSEIEPFETVLSPEQVRKDLYGSFFETHLHEIPGRLEDILGFYLPDEATFPQIRLRERFLKRHFGRDLGNLRRIVLAGMGASYNPACMGRALFQQLMPEIEVVAMQPVHLENAARFFVPEKDLVLLLNWASTNTNMVELARELRELQVPMIGITEKVFADMALVAAKSGGVMPVLSGEEITVSAIKSTVCMLFCLQLFCLWLARVRGREGMAAKTLEKLRRIPGAIHDLLENPEAEAFSLQLAEKSGESYSAVVFDALCPMGTGEEIAFKLEESSWTAIGKPLDYRNLYDCALKPGPEPNEHLVLVHATHQQRLPEALDLMKRLYMADVPFAAISFENPYQSEMEFYSRNHLMLLPKLDDPLQPLIDLPFYYQFAFRYGQAHGRSPDEFPRNRAKSVTAGVGRPKKLPSPGEELRRLEAQAGDLGFLLSLPPLAPLPEGKAAFPDRQEDREESVSSVYSPDKGPAEGGQTAWEQEAFSAWESAYYAGLQQLCRILNSPDPLGGLFRQRPDHQQLVELKEYFPAEEEILLIPFDRPAEAAARDFARLWNRFIDCSIRVGACGAPPARFSQEALLIALASEAPGEALLSDRMADFPQDRIWLGPAIQAPFSRIFADSMGYFPLSSPPGLRYEPLYAGLTLLFIQAQAIQNRKRARPVAAHLAQAHTAVSLLLNDSGLRGRMLRIMAENRPYESAFFISPPNGTGLAWTDIFDRSGSMAFQWHAYGESAHGPVVTIDNQVDAKFVRLEPREVMVSQYGENRVAQWERQYLNGQNVEDFLQRHPDEQPSFMERPFYAEGAWYLPVLRDAYDTHQDNLIFLDATQSRYLDRLLDELSTFGCRYARTLLITQEALHTETQAMSQYPISHVLSLPAIPVNGRNYPIPEPLLPIVMNLLGVAMAAAAAQVRGMAFRPADKSRLFEDHFGQIGRILLRYGVPLRYMSRFVLQALLPLSQLVGQVQGSARYQVRAIQSEAELQEMQAELRSPATTMDNFKYYQSLGPGEAVPEFFLLRTEPHTLEGSIQKEIDPMLDDGQWSQWTEPSGNIWKVLRHQVPGVRELPQRRAVLLLPLIENGNGWLFYFHIRYIAWDHRRPLGPQLAVLIRALGKEISFHHHITPRYLKIASRFNDMLATQIQTWDDRLMALVSLPQLFNKVSVDIVSLLVERSWEILGEKELPDGPRPLDGILDALERVWEKMPQAEYEDDKQRWADLRALMKAELEN